MNLLRSMFIGGALLGALAGVASADTIILTPCGSFNFAQPQPSSPGIDTGTGGCTVPTIPGGDTLQSDYLVYNIDYSNGTSGVTDTDVNAYTFSSSSGTLANHGTPTDTITLTGGIFSSQPGTDSLSLTFNAQSGSGSQTIPAGFYDAFTTLPVAGATVTTSWNDYFSSGGAIASTGAVYLVTDYTVPPSAPEPATMVLFGSALVGLGMLRKRVRS